MTHNEMKNEIAQAIHAAISKWEDEHGELENGDVFVTEFDNGIMVIEAVDDIYKVSVLGEKPYRISRSIQSLEDQNGMD